jgi:hypothetical protein
MPVGVACVVDAFAVVSGTGADAERAAARFAGAAGASPTTSSTREFHAPHPAHWPVHFGCSCPQSVQT